MIFAGAGKIAGKIHESGAAKSQHRETHETAARRSGNSKLQFKKTNLGWFYEIEIDEN
jgi:hypothetical protein